MTNLLGSAWLVSLLAILWMWGRAPCWLVAGSLAFPAYYMAASWVTSIRYWRRADRPRDPRRDRLN